MLNDKKFQIIYNEFLESNLTVRDFCSNQQMNEAKFYYWKNKLKTLLPPKTGFIPLIIAHEKQVRSSKLPVTVKDKSGFISNPATVDKTISCEINYPNGVCLKLNELPEVTVLHSLLLLTHQRNV